MLHNAVEIEGKLINPSIKEKLLGLRLTAFDLDHADSVTLTIEDASSSTTTRIDDRSSRSFRAWKSGEVAASWLNYKTSMSNRNRDFSGIRSEREDKTIEARNHADG